jgi:hypothetical protein
VTATVKEAIVPAAAHSHRAVASWPAIRGRDPPL